MCNTERKFPMKRQEMEEITRFEWFKRIFETLRNIEQEQPLLVATPNE